MSLPRAGLSWFLLLVWCACAVAEAPPTKTSADAVGEKSATSKKATEPEFIRVVRDDDGDVLSMDTAIVTYEGVNAEGEKVTVDLIGAVHIADKKYYNQLNREFKNYEAVLYELVAPKDSAPMRGQAGAYKPVGAMLDLDDQLEHIDYEQENFVHADMTWDQVVQSMKKRNESLLKMYFRMVGYTIAKQSEKENGAGSDANLLAALFFSSNKALAVKRIMAEQFESMGGNMGGLSGPEGSTIITERNKAAFLVLDEQIKAGKKRLSIFYGAGHLADMEKRLLEDYKFKRGKARWVTAWDLKD